ncbi:hypothetical protein NDU88_007030 [Pleurodeles waltl]|uniref:Reverse transcriptase domain-containing protein n=1 Tax=Pleurodeles waltl TaxID=8319 RepID=A0AAV7NAE2_PLEWA|nr:hypothetical protein NDU88_007030 [Pleurodeles waltl]
MIFAALQLQEKCQERNRDLYTMFKDVAKAFDTVSHEGLWRIMEKFGCPGKFISMVRHLYDSMLARILENGDSSNAFPVTNGAKQGYVLVPMLFSMMFSAMLSNAFCDDEETSIKTRYRTCGRLFNLRRLQAKTKVKDDCPLNAATEANMQKSMNHFSTACRNFGLTISIKKIEARTAEDECRTNYHS